MQIHRGLPKNIPKSKTKPKIIRMMGSTQDTPRQDIVSLTNSINISARSQTPKKSQQSNKSAHQIKSKEKPIKSPVVTQHHPIKILGNDKKSIYHQPDTNTLQNKYQGSYQKKQTKINQLIDNSTQFWTNSQVETIKSPENKFILSKCEIMLKNGENWSTYIGEQLNKKKTGYGILYFKNKDKFMGGFKEGKATGHGTYYDYEAKKRIMGVWLNNQITQLNQIIIQKV